MKMKAVLEALLCLKHKRVRAKEGTYQGGYRSQITLFEIDFSRILSALGTKIDGVANKLGWGGTN